MKLRFTIILLLMLPSSVFAQDNTEFRMDCVTRNIAQEKPRICRHEISGTEARFTLPNACEKTQWQLVQYTDRLIAPLKEPSFISTQDCQAGALTVSLPTVTERSVFALKMGDQQEFFILYPATMWEPLQHYSKEKPLIVYERTPSLLPMLEGFGLTVLSKPQNELAPLCIWVKNTPEETFPYRCTKLITFLPATDELPFITRRTAQGTRYIDIQMPLLNHLQKHPFIQQQFISLITKGD
jgi:hypothetical protein